MENSAERVTEVATGPMAGLRADDAVTHTAAEKSVWRRLPLRTGLALSIVIHAAALLFAIRQVAEPFDAMSMNAIVVDIVSAEDTAAAPKPEPAGPIASPAPYMTASANPAAESIPLAGWRPATQPPAQSSFGVEALANMLHVDLVPAGATDAPPTESKLEQSSAIAAFKARLQSCWTPSPGADAKKLKIVIRVSLDRGGRLVEDPILLEAPASAAGPPVVAAAIRALRQCEPYNFLPADKYDEWKVLDLRFSQSGVS